MEWNLRICLILLATFGFQLRTLSFSTEICNLAATGHGAIFKHLPSLAAFDPGRLALANGIYRGLGSCHGHLQAAPPDVKQGTDGLHYTRRRPLFNAGGLIPHGRRLDAGMREHGDRRAPSRSDALDHRRGVLGRQHVPPPAARFVRSGAAWRGRGRGDGRLGEAEPGHAPCRQAGKTQRPLSPRVGSDRLSPTTT
jgi:hypothetical protein